MTNLFGKIPYKEALVVSQATVIEKTEEISSLKTTTTKLLKRVEYMEREHVGTKKVLVSNSLLLSQYTCFHNNEINSNI